MVRVRFRVYLLRSVHFYQAFCTLVVHYCYVTGGVWLSFQVSRSTGVSIATAFLQSNLASLRLPQNFTLWQQATIEITCHDHSIIACSCHIYIHIYIWVLFFAHIPLVVNRTFNAMPTERLQQHPLLFTMNHMDRMFLLWRLHLAQPSHPGHSTILLQSKSLIGKCAKLHTVATSNNRDQLMRSLYYCFFAPHIYGCSSLCTSCSCWIAHSTPTERLQQYVWTLFSTLATCSF